VSDSDISELEREAAELEGPGVKKAAPRDFEELCEEHAALAMTRAVHVSDPSQRQLAKRLRRNDRTLRDYCSGARSAPLKVAFMLPRAGKIAVARALLAAAKNDDSEPMPPSATGTEGR
jgi:hypothetical protein